MSRHHTCHAVNCNRQVPPRLHMCKPHWSMVPRRLQRNLWANYRPGQENDMQPTAAYLIAASECVRAVGEAEGQPIEEIEFEVNLYLTWAGFADDIPEDTPQADKEKPDV